MTIDGRMPDPSPSLRNVALLALAVLAAFSEAAYLGLGLVAKSCLTGVAACGETLDTTIRGIFEAGTAADGTTHVFNKFSFGLPGLNNLYFIVLNPSAAAERVKFLETVVISYIVGFMMIAGFLATARGQAAPVKVVLAAAFGTGWYLLYNGAENSIFGGELSFMLKTRLAEVPIATLALLCLTPWTRKRAD